METKILTKSGKSLWIREPRRGDAEQMLNLINEMVDEDEMIMCNQKQTPEKEKKYLNQLLKDIATHQVVTLLAFDGPKLVAACDIKKGRYRSNHVGLFGIIISHKYRRDGLGRVLSQQVIDLSKTRLKLSLIELHVFNLNHAAKALYESLGFVPCGSLPDSIQYQNQLISQTHMYKRLVDKH